MANTKKWRNFGLLVNIRWSHLFCTKFSRIVALRQLYSCLHRRFNPVIKLKEWFYWSFTFSAFWAPCHNGAFYMLNILDLTSRPSWPHYVRAARLLAWELQSQRRRNHHSLWLCKGFRRRTRDELELEAAPWRLGPLPNVLTITKVSLTYSVLFA